MNKIKLLVGVLALLTLNSCQDDYNPYISCDPEPNLTNVDEEQLALDIAAIDEYLLENNIDAETHPSGLRYQIIEEGEPETNPGVCQAVYIQYEGKLMSTGEVFDKTFPNQSVTFTLKSLILGWQIGVPLIGTGGKIVLYIPSQLGYGKSGSTGKIPPNSNLIFTIELVDVQ